MERSGIDMLKEILYKLEILEKKIDILEYNVKSIVNVSNITNKPVSTKDDVVKSLIPNTKDIIAEKRREIEKGFSNFRFEATDATKMKEFASRPQMRVGPTHVMVKGKMLANLDGKDVSLSKISVTIYNDKDEVVKKTKTNRAGHWMSQLPPGKYVALFEGELNGKKLVSQNRNFEVPEKLPEGQTELEVV